jgi:hypothetical protein
VPAAPRLPDQGRPARADKLPKVYRLNFMVGRSAWWRG